MTRLDIERAELREFTADVQAEAARNLELLRDIERTIASVARLTKHLKTDAEFAEKANASLSGINGVIDPDDSIQNALQESQDSVHSLYELLIEKRQSGRNDQRLCDDDGIEDVYTEAIAAAADLHNAINTLRWNIGEHDIDEGEHTTHPENLISDPEALKASLLALRK